MHNSLIDIILQQVEDIRELLTYCEVGLDLRIFLESRSEVLILVQIIDGYIDRSCSDKMRESRRRRRGYGRSHGNIYTVYGMRKIRFDLIASCGGGTAYPARIRSGGGPIGVSSTEHLYRVIHTQFRGVIRLRPAYPMMGKPALAQYEA